MPIPTLGKLQNNIYGIRSRSNPRLAQASELSVTGSLAVNVGTYAAFGKPAPKKSVVATLAQAPITGAGNAFKVNVINGPNANQVTIEVRDDANTLATAAAKVNVMGYLGQF